MSDQLCEICNNLQKASDDDDYLFRGSFISEIVFKSADRGCEGCKIIRRLCLTNYMHMQPYDDYSMNIWLGTRIRIEILWKGSFMKTIDPFVQHSENQLAQFRSNCDVDPISDSPWPCLPVYSVKKPPPPALDSSCLRIGDWLGECRSFHEHCRDTEEALLPTRVIDVGSALVEPRLHISGETERASYFALSHCWGPSDPKIPRLVTTRANFKHHCVKLPISSLPKTFRDAVEVTRNLGIRFLWIDSLCVIQGDTADWVHEASKMVCFV